MSDSVTPRMTQQEEEAKRREFAEAMYRMHVNESWWTRSSLPFLFGGCACVVITFGMLWYFAPKEPPASIFIPLGLCLVFLVAHIVSHRHIHDRFKAEHPEDYHIWRTGEIPPRPEDWSANIGDAVKIYD